MQRKHWTLLAVCVATFMLLLDITIVNVALPDIARSLHASFSELQWVIDAYALLLAALLLTAGSLADLIGRRRIFAAGLALFTAASLLCGLATSAVMLDLSRGVQGIGGAMMFATSLALIAQEWHGRDRGTAFGLWGATTGAAVAVGPLIGGALTQGFGWQYIFFINVPIGAAAIALTLSKLAEGRDADASGIDWAGVATFSGGLFALVFALIRGNDEGWASTPIVALLVAAGALLAAFVVVEMRQERSMLDLSLFRRPAFVGASIVAFAMSASIFSLFLYQTLYLQDILGYSPLGAGLRFLPSTLLSFAVAPLAGKLSAYVPVRALLGGGLVLVAVGIWLMHGVEVTSGWTVLLAGFIVSGAGVGMVNPPLASAAIGVVDNERAGMASGINATFRQIGIATGIAGLGAVFQSRVVGRATELLGGVHGLPAPVVHRVAQAISGGGAQGAIQSAPRPARAAVAHAARASFIVGFNEILAIAAVVALVGGLFGLALVRGRDFVSQGGAAPGAPAEETVAVG